MATACDSPVTALPFWVELAFGALLAALQAAITLSTASNGVRDLFILPPLAGVGSTGKASRFIW